MLKRNATLYTALLLVALLAGLNNLAYVHSYYWVYWWYDVMMHSLAGLALGFFVYWGSFVSGLLFKKPKSRAFMLTWTIISVFIIGVGWEAFEYVNNIAGPSFEGYVQDTINDIVLDTCGAAVAALIATSKRKR